MLEKLIHYGTLWGVFFLIALSLGYPGLSRYSPANTVNLDDSAVYYQLTKDGLDAVNTDHRSTRVLVPFMARPIHYLLGGKVGSWDSVQFSLLIIASIFCASIAILIIKICEYIFKDKIVGVIASFIFYTNFSVSNLYLAGLVDAAECFFITLLFYLLLQRRWQYLPIIAIFATLAKETFLPIGVCIVSVWWLYTAIQEKKIDIESLLWMACFALVSIIVVVALKSYALGGIVMPWQYADSMESSYGFTFERILVEIRRFSYVFIWLLPLAVFRFNKIPMQLLASAFLTLAAIFVMGIWAGVSGAAMSRYMFNIAGPLLSISAALFLIDLLKQDKKVTI